VSPQEFWRYVGEIANGLAALHAVNITHRDIKPENIFLTSSGHLKLGLHTFFSQAPFNLDGSSSGDFGLAKRSNSSTVQLASVAGTGYAFFLPVPPTLPLFRCSEYMSPEMLAGMLFVACRSSSSFHPLPFPFPLLCSYDTKADIFALGVIASELLTGATPRQLGLIDRLGSTPLPPPTGRMLYTALPPHLRDFVLSLHHPVCLRSFLVFSHHHFLRSVLVSHSLSSPTDHRTHTSALLPQKCSRFLRLLPPLLRHNLSPVS
jgi:serine/threonine protein kinase